MIRSIFMCWFSNWELFSLIFFLLISIDLRAATFIDSILIADAKNIHQWNCEGFFNILLTSLSKGLALSLFCCRYVVFIGFIFIFYPGMSKSYKILRKKIQELIQQMANVLHTENMTEDQLDAMAGSETLRALVTSFGMTRNNKAGFFSFSIFYH